MQYTVTDIQRFCMHDGPGIRTTIFLKGCPLNCFWCHNPETKSARPQLLHHAAKCTGCMACFRCPRSVHSNQNGAHHIAHERCVACGQCVESCPTNALSIAGKVMTGQEIIDIALKDRAFYGDTGGITLSGGEPMLHPEACIELLALAKQSGLHTAIETCGFFPAKYVEPLCRVCDCLLWDIKDTDDARHIRNTGVSNACILKNLHLADTYGVPIILRCVLLKGVNLNDEHLDAVKRLKSSLKNALRVDLLPCHSLGNSKTQALGQAITDLTPFEPTQEDMDYAHSRINA